MDIERIFSIVNTSVGIIQTLAQRGKDISTVVTTVKNIVSKRPEDVTEADLDEAERILDEKLDEFEKPLNRKD